MIERGPTKEKNEEKGAYEGKGIDPQKIFYSTSIKKVPRAYESLDTALQATRVI
jgi:hypothetical protein